MGFFDDLFGSNTRPAPPREQYHEYQIELASGTRTVTTNVHHDHPDWPHRMAEQIRRFASKEDLESLKCGAGIICSIIALGVAPLTIYNAATGRGNTARIRNIEEIVSRHFHR